MSRILVATRKGLFFVERTGGAWSVARTAFLGEALTMTLAARGGLYVATRLGHFGAHLHKSSDDGASWTELAAPQYPEAPEGGDKDGFGRPWPWKLDTIWALEAGASDGELWCGTIPGGLFRSTDDGASWSLVRALWDDPRRKQWFGGGYDTPGIHSVLVDPRGGRRVTVGVSCGGVWTSADAGDTWSLVGKGMRAAYVPTEQQGTLEVQDPHRLACCNAAPDVVWTQHHNGVFKSIDGARTFTEITNVPPSTFGFACAVHPRDANTVWLVPAQADAKRIPVDGKVVVARTRDGGESWQTLSRGLPAKHAYDLVYRHGLDVDEAGDTLAMGSTTGNLWVSDDQGDSWSTIPNLPPIYAVRFG